MGKDNSNRRVMNRSNPSFSCHGPSQSVVTKLVASCGSAPQRDGFFLFCLAMHEHIRGKMLKVLKESQSASKSKGKGSPVSSAEMVTSAAVAAELARLWSELGETQRKSWRSQAAVLDTEFTSHPPRHGTWSSADSSVQGDNDDDSSSPPSDSSARSLPSSMSTSYLSACSTVSYSSAKTARSKDGRSGGRKLRDEDSIARNDACGSRISSGDSLESRTALSESLRSPTTHVRLPSLAMSVGTMEADTDASIVYPLHLRPAGPPTFPEPDACRELEPYHLHCSVSLDGLPRPLQHSSALVDPRPQPTSKLAQASSGPSLRAEGLVRETGDGGDSGPSPKTVRCGSGNGLAALEHLTVPARRASSTPLRPRPPQVVSVTYVGNLFAPGKGSLDLRALCANGPLADEGRPGPRGWAWRGGSCGDAVERGRIGGVSRPDADQAKLRVGVLSGEVVSVKLHTNGRLQLTGSGDEEACLQAARLVAAAVNLTARVHPGLVVNLPSGADGAAEAAGAPVACGAVVDPDRLVRPRRAALSCEFDAGFLAAGFAVDLGRLATLLERMQESGAPLEGAVIVRDTRGSSVRVKLGLPDLPPASRPAAVAENPTAGAAASLRWPAGAGKKWVTLTLWAAGRVLIAGAADWTEVEQAQGYAASLLSDAAHAVALPLSASLSPPTPGALDIDRAAALSAPQVPTAAKLDALLAAAAAAAAVGGGGPSELRPTLASLSAASRGVAAGTAGKAVGGGAGGRVEGEPRKRGREDGGAL